MQSNRPMQYASIVTNISNFPALSTFQFFRYHIPLKVTQDPGSDVNIMSIYNQVDLNL
jgi:hypothetical protein